jgi:methionyl-tRNA formyltransferase
MTNDRTSLRVVLVAEEAAGVQALRAIGASAATLVAVLTSSDGANQRGVSVASVARKLGCTVWPGEQVRSPDLAERLRAARVDLLINVHSLHRIDEAVVEAPRLGSFNLHPGPLPAFAGLNAPSWAIYLGERRYAVTLHRMARGIDTGAIAYESWFPLDDRATGLSVSTTCVRLGVPLIERLLGDAQRGAASIPGAHQDPRLRRVFRRRDVPHGGQVRWDLPAEEIDRWVRASDFHPLPSPWGYPITRLAGRTVGLARVSLDHAGSPTARAAPAAPGTIVATDEQAVTVTTGSGALMLHTIVVDDARVPAVAHLKRGMRLH